MEVVNKTLVEIGAGDKTHIILYNKVDRIEPLSMEEEENSDPDHMDIQQLLSIRSDSEVYISATKKLNIDVFRDVLIKEVRKAWDADIIPQLPEGMVGTGCVMKIDVAPCANSPSFCENCPLSFGLARV